MARCLNCIHCDVCDSDRHDKERLYGDCSDFLHDVVPREEVDHIKADTAREIFVEIENIAYTHFDVRGDEESLEILIDEFAELKKKYMEGLTDGKRTDR